jgi:hypothetical protein
MPGFGLARNPLSVMAFLVMNDCEVALDTLLEPRTVVHEADGSVLMLDFRSFEPKPALTPSTILFALVTVSVEGRTAVQYADGAVDIWVERGVGSATAWGAST